MTVETMRKSERSGQSAEQRDKMYKDCAKPNDTSLTRVWPVRLRCEDAERMGKVAWGVACNVELEDNERVNVVTSGGKTWEATVANLHETKQRRVRYGRKVQVHTTYMYATFYEPKPANPGKMRLMNAAPGTAEYDNY